MGNTYTGECFIQAQRVDGSATAYGLLLQPNGGGINCFANSVYMGALTATSGSFTNTATGQAFLATGTVAGYGPNMMAMDANGTYGTRLMAFGPNASTKGTMNFNLWTSDTSSYINALSLATGGATFASSVSMGALTATKAYTGTIAAPIVSASNIPGITFLNTGVAKNWAMLGNYNDAASISLLYSSAASPGGSPDTEVIRVNAGGAVNFFSAATFASSVSMGALTATSGTINGTLTMGSNSVFWDKSGLRSWQAYVNQTSGAFFIASGDNLGSIVLACTSVSMGALTATSGTINGTLTMGSNSVFWDKSGLRSWQAYVNQTSGAFFIASGDNLGSIVLACTSVSMGALTATTGLFSGNVQFGSGYADFADRNVPGVFNSRYLSRNGNNLFWRSDGTNDSLVLTLANVGSAAAMLQATIALVNAPSVGTLAQMYANTPSSGTNPYWFATDQLNTNDSTYGQLFQWNGSSWVNTGLANTVTPVITAGRIQAGAIGTNALAATLVMASIITSTGYTAGTYSAAPYGFKFNGTAFTTYLLDGTSMSSFMEIGADASVGGLKAATIANRVKGNNFVQNGAGTTDVFIPDGVISIEVTLQAAGGNGQVGAQDGGNAGQYIKKQVTVKPHNTYRLTGGAVGANSTFSWVSFDGTSGFSSDSGFTTITATFGTNGITNSLDGANGASNPYPYQTPENGWVVNGGLGGHSANATVTSGSGGSVGQQGGGNGTTNGTYQNGGGGGASAMAPGGNGNWNQSSRAGGNGTFGSGGGSGYTAGTGGACYLRARWGF